MLVLSFAVEGAGNCAEIDGMPAEPDRDGAPPDPVAGLKNRDAGPVLQAGPGGRNACRACPDHGHIHLSGRFGQTRHGDRAQMQCTDC